MDDNKLNKIIDDRITQYLTDKQFNLSKITNHIHSGTDSNQINQKDIQLGEKYITTLSVDNPLAISTSGTVVISGVYNPIRISYQGFAANNASTAFALAAPGAMDDINALLSTNWVYNTGARNVTFSNGDVRYVLFTNGSPTVTWSTGLSSATTVSITVGANLRAISNGEINFGTCFLFNDATPPIDIATNGPGIPFIQGCNAMYVDSNDLTKNRVDDSPLDFAYILDDTATIVARATLDTFNNQTGLLSMTFVLGPNWKIQGAFTVT